jgi:hypothetical protein
VVGGRRDGYSSDWIEIYNPTDKTDNLDNSPNSFKMNLPSYGQLRIAKKTQSHNEIKKTWRLCVLVAKIRVRKRALSIILPEI